MVSMLTEAEYRFLEAIRKDGVVPSDRKGMAHRLASMGILRLGYDDSGDAFHETASLTGLGERMYRRAELEHDFVKRFRHALVRPLFRTDV